MYCQEVKNNNLKKVILEIIISAGFFSGLDKIAFHDRVLLIVVPEEIPGFVFHDFLFDQGGEVGLISGSSALPTTSKRHTPAFNPFLASF